MTLTRIWLAYTLACVAFAILGAIVIAPWFAGIVAVQADSACKSRTMPREPVFAQSFGADQVLAAPRPQEHG